MSWHRKRMAEWLKRNPTFDVVLTRLGRKRKVKKSLRRIDVEGFAMTVLDCAKCKWRIYLEAHHHYGSGKPSKINWWRFKSKKDYEDYKKWRSKMLRKKLACPKCKNDTFRYVRTDVMDHGKLYSELAP